MEFFSSFIPPVYTDGHIRSVFTDEMIYGIFRIKKKRRFADVEVFASDFTDRIIEGFKPGSPYIEVTDSPSELPTESPTKVLRR